MGCLKILPSQDSIDCLAVICALTKVHMYNEAQDFLDHKGEIDAMISVLHAQRAPLAPEMVVLDLGAGQGMHAGFLSVIAGRVYCADLLNYSTLYEGQFLEC